MGHQNHGSYLQCKRNIERSRNVTKLLCAFELFLVEPLLKQMLPVLLQDRAHKLHGLRTVELSLVKQHAEVLKNDRQLALNRCACLLETLDGLWGPEKSTGRVCGNLRSLSPVARLAKLIELLLVQIVGARQTCAGRELECELAVFWASQQIIDNIVLVDCDIENLTLAVDANNSRGVSIANRGEDGL